MNNDKNNSSEKECGRTQESQEIEWKWSWQDEFLKWLCGYANTDGGTLNIGVNDDGYVVGVEDAKVLQEQLPNKITDKLGILASIKVHTAKQGTNLRYGTDVPSEIAKKLINEYVCGFINTQNVAEDDRRYKPLSILLILSSPFLLKNKGFL